MGFAYAYSRTTGYSPHSKPLRNQSPSSENHIVAAAAAIMVISSANNGSFVRQIKN